MTQDQRPWMFIADLHLNEALPLTTAAFEHFIKETAAQAGAVIILGDLFEFWIGDDMLDTSFAAGVAATLSTLGQRGIALYLMHGNRDFLLGSRFMRAAGAQLMPDPSVIEAFGQRLVLAHGDALCCADPHYQRYRRLTRLPGVQRFFLAWPLRWRLRLARRLRHNSAAAMRAPSPRYDVTAPEVAQLFSDTGTSLMVHGHTHLPARHETTGRVRWVLSDWEFDHGAPRGSYLRLDADGLRSVALD